MSAEYDKIARAYQQSKTLLFRECINNNPDQPPRTFPACGQYGFNKGAPGGGVIK